MRNTLKILNLYIQNIGFRWLFGFVCVAAVVSRIFVMKKNFMIAEEFFTLLFVMVLWLFFHMGILLKYQFANSRASLLPGHRRGHSAAFLIIYAFLIFCGLVWQIGMPLQLPWMSVESMIGSLSTCFLISLFVVALGYFSMGRLLLYGYCLILIVSVFSMDIIDIFNREIWANYVPIGIWVIGIAVLLRRLQTIKEEHVEYGHLLAWPPKSMGRYHRTFKKGFFGKDPKERAIATAFPKEKNVLARLWHWDLVEGNTPNILSALFWTAAIMYGLIFFHVEWAVVWLERISNLFLMYVLTPLVILAIFYYKRMIFWGYDIIRPVSRPAYFRDQAFVVFLHLFAYWVFTVLALAILPKLLFQIGPGLTLRGALFFILSGSFVFLIAAVVSVLSAIDSVPRIIFNGGLISCLAIALFDIVPELTVAGYGLCIWACLASGLIFINKGYHAWCNKEYS